MSHDKRMDAYLRESLDLLEDDGFEVIENEQLDDRRFRAVAVKVQGYGLGSQELAFVFSRFAELTRDKYEDFVDDAYAYAKESRKSSLPLGLNNLLWAYPVALTEVVGDKVVRSVTGSTPRIQGFGYAAFPVVYDAGADDVYFYEGGGSRGLKLVAKVAEKYLVPD